MFALRTTAGSVGRVAGTMSSPLTGSAFVPGAVAVKKLLVPGKARTHQASGNIALGTSVFGGLRARFLHNDIPMPDFTAYKRDENSSDVQRRSFTYFMAGAGTVAGAMAAKSSVVNLLGSMSATADVLALAKIEVDLTAIPEGKNFTVKWRGKPLVIRHRTLEEIENVNNVNMADLKDPELDSVRAKKPEWLIMVAVCTHLGCIPVGEAGEYGGWFCPCHGSHYDVSGRIRKGPAPTNMEVPPYEFAEGGSKVVVG